MSSHQSDHTHHCGGCCGHEVPRVPVAPVRDAKGGFSRRTLLLGLGTVAMGQWALRQTEAKEKPVRRAGAPGVSPPKGLVVQPVLTHSIHQRRKQSSWRPWGGVMSAEDADQEARRIEGELKEMVETADFALETRPVKIVRSKPEAEAIRDGDADVLLIFAATGGGHLLETMVSPQRPSIMFVRHRSGPVYLWYEIAHPRFLRKTVDEYAQTGMDVHDVVVDKYEDVLWRLRALYGLKNAWGQRIVAIGDASGWGAGGRKAPELAREKWHMEILPVSYDDLGKRIQAARKDAKRVATAQAAGRDYLGQRGIRLESDRGKKGVEDLRGAVERAFLLNTVFEDLMHEADASALTVNHCMGTIMPISETTACLPLSLLNDAGYMAFCESDFVVIPSGVLLHHICGTPVFLNDPTYPHHGVVTLAHCTAPRKMDGRRYEKTKIMTHFESDYGAAPKVEFSKGEVVTVIDPDFNEKRWIGFRGHTLETPFMHICRAQVDVAIEGDCTELLEKMVGFHWMMSYGDYRKEVGYALKKAGIDWLDVSEGATT